MAKSILLGAGRRMMIRESIIGLRLWMTQIWNQGLEGYSRDPGLDQNAVRDSGKRKIS